jgi:hypothetical protein
MAIIPAMPGRHHAPPLGATGAAFELPLPQARTVRSRSSSGDRLTTAGPSPPGIPAFDPWSQCRHSSAEMAMNGSDSRKLWMCYSAGRTSRPPPTAARTLVLVLLCEVNPALLALCVAASLVHEATAIWEDGYREGIRTEVLRSADAGESAAFIRSAHSHRNAGLNRPRAGRCHARVQISAACVVLSLPDSGQTTSRNGVSRDSAKAAIQRAARAPSMAR